MDVQLHVGSFFEHLGDEGLHGFEVDVYVPDAVVGVGDALGEEAEELVDVVTFVGSDETLLAGFD